ncbi:uncharacterized protein TRAVEDRAFT_63336 [Trametes versicolor FP-101664 SS1]|uniref:uncharacterized protein n=1 Tax=Trametes versicolor (strain FP-101664) TaxID=717944 RepID=UPI000462127A|nr:uncharacterized protein TRAVEDRAFT_63336 [Trametes versicolor FP-101664 SS1]EIW61677.1 hypothetical protein TRAVEDRAFT_63336 [Trametes versicolor FP-101664 SS1]
MSQSNDSQNALAPIPHHQYSPPPASQHPLARDGLDQSSHVALLATCGITVRDFAYETTLPPVTTVPRFAVQTQPRTRTLKRTRDMLNGNADGEESDVEDPSIPRTWYIDSNGTGVSRSSRFRKRAQALGRTLTEPADEEPAQSQGLTTREGGFALPCALRAVSPAGPSQGAQCPSTPHRPRRQAQTTSLSPLAITNNVSPSQASQQGESQESEPWIDTPLVTPNGSLQWPLPTVQNTSAMPASQLESILPQLPDEDDVTMSQLGFSPARSQARSQHPAVFGSSPAGTPSRRRHDLQLPPQAEFNRFAPSSSKSPPSSVSPPPTTPVLQDARPSSPRYHLRQRPPAAVVANTKKPTTGRGRALSRTRTSNQGAARKTENAAPPARKKAKPSPPADAPLGKTRYDRRKNGDVPVSEAIR